MNVVVYVSRQLERINLIFTICGSLVSFSGLFCGLLLDFLGQMVSVLVGRWAEKTVITIMLMIMIIMIMIMIIIIIVYMKRVKSLQWQCVWFRSSLFLVGCLMIALCNPNGMDTTAYSTHHVWTCFVVLNPRSCMCMLLLLSPLFWFTCNSGR